MKVRIAAIGRARSGPEAALVDDYLSRFGKTGRSMHLGPAELLEIEDRKGGGRDAEASLLSAAIPDGAIVLALDERGKAMTSREFAELLARLRDDGNRELVALIGGADGLAPALRAKCDHVLSFGKMVWPHMLARVMLAEQLYRAATILAGSPYHRD